MGAPSCPEPAEGARNRPVACTQLPIAPEKAQPTSAAPALLVPAQVSLAERSFPWRQRPPRHAGEAQCTQQANQAAGCRVALRQRPAAHHLAPVPLRRREQDVMKLSEWQLREPGGREGLESGGGRAGGSGGGAGVPPQPTLLPLPARSDERLQGGAGGGQHLGVPRGVQGPARQCVRLARLCAAACGGRGWGAGAVRLRQAVALCSCCCCCCC